MRVGNARPLSLFPECEIGYEALDGKPAASLLRKASEWKSDLIVLGRHGRSAVGRFFLGSVSQEVAEKAVVLNNDINDL